MIQINDTDGPIEAAGKIVYATREDLRDMFDIDEIKELACYLFMFYLQHKGEEVSE